MYDNGRIEVFDSWRIAARRLASKTLRAHVGTSKRIVVAVVALHLSVSNAEENKPDFSGIWESVVWSTEGWPVEPPFTEAGRAAQDAWAASPENDPSLRCWIPLGRIISAPMPHEIIAHDGRFTILYEYEHQVRRVWMDGRSHPEDAYPTIMGHTVGRWDGDVLVLETVNMEAGLFRPQGFPYTENLRLTETLTLVDDGEHMLSEITIEDPAYYSEPWTVRKRYRRSDTEIKDYECIIREHLPAGN